MTARDRQRRPRGARDVGREKLLTAARGLFRSRAKHEISRQDIARKAGMTPALMTYYFDTKADLVLAATKPVVAEAIAELMAVLDQQAPFPVRFREVILHFMDFAARNAPILDLFIESTLESGDEEARNLIVTCLDRLGNFFAAAVEAGAISRDTNPRFLLLTLWGTCRSVGEESPIPFQVIEGTSSRHALREMHADLILGLTLHGITPDKALAGPRYLRPSEVSVPF